MLKFFATCLSYLKFLRNHFDYVQQNYSRIYNKIFSYWRTTTWHALTNKHLTFHLKNENVHNFFLSKFRKESISLFFFFLRISIFVTYLYKIFLLKLLAQYIFLFFLQEKNKKRKKEGKRCKLKKKNRPIKESSWAAESMR